MELLKDEVKQKSAQLTRYGAFTLEDQNRSKDMQRVLLGPVQMHNQTDITPTIFLSIDDIVTLEVKPAQRSPRYININVTDEISELIDGPTGAPAIQIDEILLEPGTKHINMAPDYKFTMSIYRDAESEELDVNKCIEPNCEGRLLHRRIAVIPNPENILRLVRRGPKLQIPVQFLCSALHFNGSKFIVKIQFISKLYNRSFEGTFAVWTTEQYMLFEKSRGSSVVFTDTETPLAMLGQAVMDMGEEKGVPPSIAPPTSPSLLFQQVNSISGFPVHDSTTKGSVASVLG